MTTPDGRPAPRRQAPSTGTRRPSDVPTTDPAAAAQSAGLHYVSDRRPGIRRRRTGRAFIYFSPTGDRIADPERLRWIRSLAVPPAWTDVWISPSNDGHILATGRDARGRKQYRYHPRWREVRDETKYVHLIAFGELLPRIRKHVEADLARSELCREKVLAAVVRLLELTLIRVGNEEYARLNRSFGLTTLRNRHVQVNGPRVRFRFRGKSGVVHEVGIRDRRLAGIVRHVQDLPGQELFEYVDDAGRVQAVSSEDVNAYLRDASGQDVTAKDFRTWAGTVLAFRELGAQPAAGSDADAKRTIVAAVKHVARRLGNTPATCRRSYIHPGVLDAFAEGALVQASKRDAPSEGPEPGPPTADEEPAVLELLRHGLHRAAAATDGSAAA